MKRIAHCNTEPAIELFIHLPEGIKPLDPENESEAVPLDCPPDAGPVTYGQYLRSVARYLGHNCRRTLQNLLGAQPVPIGLDSAVRIMLTSEKHGALYSVSRLTVHTHDAVRSFAVNTAFRPEQQAFVQLEYRLLGELYRKFRFPYLPRPFLIGRPVLEGTDLRVKLFITEWFENHHEFHHTGAGSGGGAMPIGIWNGGKSPRFLDAGQKEGVFAGASAILTALLDTHTFRQIYPWHHAAGDFVVDESCDPVSVRLITTRGYRRLLGKKSDARDKVLGSLHFLVNLSIRMRIDRLDGTGELVFAPARECLGGFIRGFCASWKQKTQKDPRLPEATDLFALFLGFSFEERMAFTEVAAADGRVEASEADFLAAHLSGHVRELSAALEHAMSALS
ncbi:MAG: hypothetical protein LLG06_17350 [Desulfobacteraceae bacterium]|nr:hypothetical protein [Desulfobacteraceae bacterium]